MQKKYEGDDRRRYVRIDEEDLLICEPFDPAAFGGATKKRKHVFTKSLSEGGILFESDELLSIGSLLSLQIDLPGWERYKAEFYKATVLPGKNPFVVLGKVVRVEDIGGNRYDIGVAFAAIDSGHKLALKKYMENKRVN